MTSVVEGLGCPIKGEYGTAGSTPPAPAMNLAPVISRRSAVRTAPSDSVAVLTSTKTELRGAGRGFRNPCSYTQQTTSRSIRRSAPQEDDTILAIPMSWAADNTGCVLFTVKPDISTPETDDGEATRFRRAPSGSASSWNAAASSVWPAGGFKENDVLVNFGKIRRMVFGVDGDTFEVVTWTPQGIGNAEQLNSGIVLLKALYGRDSDNDGVVDTYDTTTPVTNADWQKVMAVRVVMVARSGQREKRRGHRRGAEHGTSAPTWRSSYVAVPGGARPRSAPQALRAASCRCTVSHLNDWKHYRYKVFDTAVPLRNMLWNLGS